MKINFRPEFIKFVRWFAVALLAAGCVAALSVTWKFWTVEAIVAAFLFSGFSIFRSLINGLFVFTGSVILVWLGWLAFSKLIVTGLTVPKFPVPIVVLTVLASIVLAIAILPVDWYYNVSSAKRLEPIASEFRKRSDCNNSHCWAPDDILAKRDRVLLETNACRLFGWSVRNPLGDGAVYNTKGMYFWNVPFFPLLSDW